MEEGELLEAVGEDNEEEQVVEHLHMSDESAHEYLLVVEDGTTSLSGEDLEEDLLEEMHAMESMTVSSSVGKRGCKYEKATRFGYL